MAEEQPALEVEVVEIDGVAPPPPDPGSRRKQAPWREWRHGWTGRVRKLDPRWWPLWLLLGLIALVLLITIGIVAGVLVILYRITLGLLRSLLLLLFPNRSTEIR